MIWQIQIHRLVLSEDFISISKPDKEVILKTIRKKLSLNPESYGKPLVGQFKGYWRLRIGDYRVIYRIVKNEVIVYVIKVGIRRNDRVYKELLKRLDKV